MNKRKVVKISSTVLLIVVLLYVLKQEITDIIENKVIENTLGITDNKIINHEIKRLNIIIFLNPKEYRYYVKRADLNCQIKKYNNAINDLNKTHDLAENYAESYTFQGMIYDWIGKTDSAMIYYKISQKIYKQKLDKETDKVSRRDLMENVIYLQILQNDSLSSNIKDSLNNTIKDDDLALRIIGKSKNQIFIEKFEK